MFQIRQGCFETNSSSSHSLIVMKEDMPFPDMFEPERYVWNGKMSIWVDDLEFGRSPFDVLVDWYGRLRYAIASLGRDQYKEIEVACYRRIDGLKEIEIYGANTEFDKYGCIDHQSDGLLKAFLFEQDISLEDFIFNDRYIVVIDGDEYNILDSMINAELIDKTKIEKIRGVHGYDCNS